MPTMKASNVAWVLAALGGGIGVYAAYVQGGLFPALTAASGAFMAAAGILGWSTRPTSGPPTP